MSNQIEIHDTAFMTSTLRASNEVISHDIYAKLWNNKGTDKWVKEYLKQVTKHEAIAHCLRNRYFLDTLKNLAQNNTVEVIINFGCGFSMYPFLLDDSIINIEIDKPEIIQHKKSKILAWQKQKRLPSRNIHFIGVDFSTEYQEQLLSQINAIKKGKSSFILLEGVIFFLNLKETNNLFKLFSKIQTQGDYIGSASFEDNITDAKAFKNLLKFMKNKTNITNYLTVNDDYYNAIPNYELIDVQDYYSLSNTYLNNTSNNTDLILNEKFYLLKKQRQ